MKIDIKKCAIGYFLLSILTPLIFFSSVHALTYSFTVSNGKGGTVTSNVGGVNCSSGSTCNSSNLSEGTSITLTASPNSGKLFRRWGGVCSGTSKTCQFTLDSFWNADAYWDYKSVPMSIKFSGNGSGSVSFSGATCTSNCTRNISHSTSTATLKASPASGSKFVGWDYQNGANSCYSGGGKGSTASINTSSTCKRDLYFGVESSGGQFTYIAVPIFNKTSSSSSGSSSGSTSSGSTSTSTSSSGSSSVTEKDGTPKAPTVDKIEINGQEVSKKDPIEINSDEPLVLSGKTIPNGIITLTIHSDPITVTTKAGKKGNWSYTISGLESGDHYVEAKVKDPETKKVSKLGKLISFTVNPAAAASNPEALITEQSPEENEGGSALATIGIVLGAIVAILAGATLYLWKFQNATFNNILRRLHIKNSGNNIPPQSPSGPSYG